MAPLPGAVTARTERLAAPLRTITDFSALVVSDDPGATRVLVAVFRAMDISSLTVVGSDEVPDYDLFDLAIIATGGEVAAALDAADRIRAHHGPAGVHIVLLTLAATEEMQRAVVWKRIDAIMLKPVTILALTAHIERAIDRRMRA